MNDTAIQSLEDMLDALKLALVVIRELTEQVQDLQHRVLTLEMKEVKGNA